jgi:nicotinamide mononucleotide (NMN) deamidase PncC
VFNFTAITSTWQPVITRVYQLQEDVEEDVLGGGFGGQQQMQEAGLGIQSTQADELRTMEIAGYTADEMAAEMTESMTTTFDYVRAIADIGVLGPTAASILIGLGWITIVTFGKFMFKSILVIIDVIKVLLDLVIDVIKTILQALELIPFI